MPREVQTGLIMVPRTWFTFIYLRCLKQVWSCKDLEVHIFRRASVLVLASYTGIMLLSTLTKVYENLLQSLSPAILWLHRRLRLVVYISGAQIPPHWSNVLVGHLPPNWPNPGQGDQAQCTRGDFVAWCRSSVPPPLC